MGLPVLFSCILMVLFAAGPSMSSQTVTGIVGQSVTLPCTYSVHNGVTSMCWGRGWCPLNRCSQEIIWTDGHRMTFQHSDRYHLKENLSQGIVSLTIENLTEADAGIYCCRVEISGWFNDQKVTVNLKVEQASTVTALTTFASTHPMPTTLTSSTSTHPMLTTTEDQRSVSSTPVLDIVTTTRPSETSDGKIWTEPNIPMEANDTVTGNSEDFQNQTVIDLHGQLMTTDNRIYAGVSFSVVALVILISSIYLLKRFFSNRKKAQTLSLTFLACNNNGVLRTATEEGNHAEDNVYTVEDNVYIFEEENAYIIEEENPYVVPTCNEKQQPSKVWP